MVGQRAGKFPQTRHRTQKRGELRLPASFPPMVAKRGYGPALALLDSLIDCSTLNKKEFSVLR